MRLRTKLCCCVTLLAGLLHATPAHAWFGWLDELSGPGPFWGIDVDLRLVCFMNHLDENDVRQADMARQVPFQLFVQRLSSKPPVPPPNPRRDGPGITSASPSPPVPYPTLVIDIDPDPLEDLKKKWLKTNLEIRDELLSGRPPILSDVAAKLNQLNQSLSGAIHRSGGGTRCSDKECTDLAQVVFDNFQHVIDVVRLARYPSQSRPSNFLRIGLFERCNDPLEDELPSLKYKYAERNPIASIVMDYRALTNSAVPNSANPLDVFFHLPQIYSSGSVAGKNLNYADGKVIRLQMLETKLSWPLTGRFDFIDGQAGAGIYWFHSDGFAAGSQTFRGFVFEPIKFDIHTPARWFDGKLLSYEGKSTGKKAATFPLRMLASLSFNAGVQMFPGGFAGNRFNVDPASGVARDFPGNESLFQMGIVVNAGRVLSGIRAARAQ